MDHLIFRKGTMSWLMQEFHSNRRYGWEFDDYTLYIPWLLIDTSTINSPPPTAPSSKLAGQKSLKVEASASGGLPVEIRQIPIDLQQNLQFYLKKNIPQLVLPCQICQIIIQWSSTCSFRRVFQQKTTFVSTDYLLGLLLGHSLKKINV